MRGADSALAAGWDGDMKPTPPPEPILELIDIIARAIVEDHLREVATNDGEESNAYTPPLARTGTDVE